MEIGKELAVCRHIHERCFFQEDPKKQANELSLDNVGGVFVVLLAGMGVACTIAVVEFVWKSRKLEKKSNLKHTDLVCKVNYYR